MTAPMERIQVLDTIEKDIITCLQSAGQALVELSKEKSSLKQAEGQTHQFLKTLGHVENKLTEQINYLTQVSTGTVTILKFGISLQNVRLRKVPEPWLKQIKRLSAI
ncbi:Mediator of RNA polymerase II transcription subunit 11 [Blattella germanica]|nr:Mediator of RNA polymerase II transcription subunit 11 [Blattella germanica]